MQCKKYIPRKDSHLQYRRCKKKAVDGKYYCASHLTGDIRDCKNLADERCL